MNWSKAGAVLMFLAVALGAFGAHGLKDRLDEYGKELWKTAVLYHMVHALALFCTGKGGWLFLGGVILFSGSLYALALSGQRWLGAVTPLGGLLFLAGWLKIALAKAKAPGDSIFDRLNL